MKNGFTKPYSLPRHVDLPSTRRNGLLDDEKSKQMLSEKAEAERSTSATGWFRSCKATSQKFLTK
jgi:hypothetical protein